MKAINTAEEAIASIVSNHSNISKVPKQLRTLDLWKGLADIEKMHPYYFSYVHPQDLEEAFLYTIPKMPSYARMSLTSSDVRYRTHNMYKAAIDHTVEICPNLMSILPDDLKTPDICRSYIRKFGRVDFVPTDVLTADMCFDAIRNMSNYQNFTALAGIPSELFTIEMYKEAREAKVPYPYYVAHKNLPKQARGMVARYEVSLNHDGVKLGSIFKIPYDGHSIEGLMKAALKKSVTAFADVASCLKEEAASFLAKNPDLLRSLPMSLRYELSTSMSPDRPVLIAVTDPSCVFCASEDSLTEETVKAAALSSTSCDVLHRVPEKFLTERVCAVVCAARGLQAIPEHLRTETLCTEAVIIDPEKNVPHVPSALLSQKILEISVRLYPMSVVHVPADAPYADRLYEEAVGLDPLAIKHVPESRRTVDMCRAALEKVEAHEYIPESMLPLLVGSHRLGQRLRIYASGGFSTKTTAEGLMADAAKMLQPDVFSYVSHLFPAAAAAAAKSKHQYISYLCKEALEILEAECPELTKTNHML